MTTTVTPRLARDMEANKHPWRVRLEYRGANPRSGSYSEKWWDVTGDGSGVVEVNHGKIGSRGRAKPFVFDLQKGMDTMHKKIDKGYMCAAGAATELPSVESHTTHAELPGIYRDIRRLVENVAGSYVALDGDGSEVCRLTPEGAKKLINLSPLIRARSPQAAHSLEEISF